MTHGQYVKRTIVRDASAAKALLVQHSIIKLDAMGRSFIGNSMTDAEDEVYRRLVRRGIIPEGYEVQIDEATEIYKKANGAAYKTHNLYILDENGNVAVQGYIGYHETETSMEEPQLRITRVDTGDYTYTPAPSKERGVMTQVYEADKCDSYASDYQSGDTQYGIKVLSPDRAYIVSKQWVAVPESDDYIPITRIMRVDGDVRAAWQDVLQTASEDIPEKLEAKLDGESRTFIDTAMTEMESVGDSNGMRMMYRNLLREGVAGRRFRDLTSTKGRKEAFQATWKFIKPQLGAIRKRLSEVVEESERRHIGVRVSFDGKQYEIFNPVKMAVGQGALGDDLIAAIERKYRG